MFCEQNHHPSLQGLIHSTHKALSPVCAACWDPQGLVQVGGGGYIT